MQFNLKKNDKANVLMIGAAIGFAVTLVISILVIFAITSGLQPTFNTLENSLNGSSREVGHPNAPDNASVARWGNTSAEYANLGMGQLGTQLGTFYTLAPLILVVIAAVVILSYITRIGQ